MSNIKYEGDFLWMSLYRETLQNKIDDVLKKIGINDKGITWIICKEEYLKESESKISVFPKLVEMTSDNQYGLCRPDKNIIWITTVAIEYAYINNASKRIKSIALINDKKQDFLADVIMDELVHIVTKEDHGTSKYDDTLLHYRQMYYNTNFAERQYEIPSIKKISGILYNH